MNPLSTAALAKDLRNNVPADRPSGPGQAMAPVAFAGLLGEQQQRWAAQGDGSPAYDGSAFDVAPARREIARPATTGSPPPTQAREAQISAQQGSDRQAARTAPSAPAQNKATDKAAEARRDEAGATRHEGPGERDGAPAPAAGSGPASGASSAGGQTDAADGAEEPAADARALIDWMARWSSPGATAPLPTGGAPGVGGAAAEPAASGGAAVEPMQAGSAGIELAAQAEAGELAGGPSKAGVSNTAALESPAPAMAAPQAAAAAGAQAAGPSSPIPLSTPVDSPDFSQALASQLTTLARNGVHEAELQLNPADMGPISVQITLDGSQAQIDFAAAHARTREVLEAAWPALAASLHGAGLTLGGGGVSDQRPGARGEGDASGGRARQSMTGADDGVAASGRSVRIDAQRGLLDLYA